MQTNTVASDYRYTRIRSLIPRTAPLFNNGFSLSFPTPRYIAVEYSSDEQALWASQNDDLIALARAIDESSTNAAFTDVWDLDKNERLAMGRRVTSFMSLQDKRRIDIPSPVAPRLFITVEGGVIQDVNADTPIDVRIIDYDKEYSDGNFVPVSQGDGTTERALVSDWSADTSDPARVAEIFSIPL